MVVVEDLKRRDYVAIEAMKAIIQGCSNMGVVNYDAKTLARSAYQMADEMFAASMGIVSEPDLEPEPEPDDVKATEKHHPTTYDINRDVYYTGDAAPSSWVISPTGTSVTIRNTKEDVRKYEEREKLHAAMIKQRDEEKEAFKQHLISQITKVT